MVDIAKLAGSKRPWVGDQQAIDIEDDEYDDFKDDGTLTGNNTVSNVLWKHAKLIETGGNDTWIGSSEPGSIALDVYNDAISFPATFDFSNNSDNVTLSQLAYKTALIHADFKANDYDTLESTVETNTSNITSNTSNITTNTTDITTLKDDFKEMDVRNISSHQIELDSNSEYQIPNLFKIKYTNDTWPFVAKSDGSTFGTPQARLKIDVLNYTNFKKWTELTDHVGIYIEIDSKYNPAAIGISEIYETDGTTKDVDEWSNVIVTHIGVRKRAYFIEFVPSDTQVTLIMFAPYKIINDNNITWQELNTWDAFYTGGLTKNVQFTNGTFNNTVFYLIAYNDFIDKVDEIQPINSDGTLGTLYTRRHPYNSNSDTIALYNSIQPALDYFQWTYLSSQRSPTGSYSSDNRMRLGRSIKWTFPSDKIVNSIEIDLPSSGDFRSIKIDQNTTSRSIFRGKFTIQLVNTKHDHTEDSYNIFISETTKGVHSNTSYLALTHAAGNDSLISDIGSGNSVYLNIVETVTFDMCLGKTTTGSFQSTTTDSGTCRAQIRTCATYWGPSNKSSYHINYTISASPLLLHYDGVDYVIKPTIT